MTEKVVLKMRLTIAEYWRDRNTSIYIWPNFSHVAKTYQTVHESDRPIWENAATGNCVLQLWLITEPSEARPIPHQHSAMLILLKYLIYLSFLLCYCFHPFALTRKSFAESCKIMKTSMGEIILQLFKNILEWLLSYKGTSCTL